MKRNALLLSSLIILTAILIAVLYRDDGPEDLSTLMPQGEPPGLPEASPPPTPAPDTAKPQIIEKKKPEPVPPQKSRYNSAEWTRPKTVELMARVLFNGRPVSGAAVAIRKVRVDQEGNRDPLNNSFHYLTNDLATDSNLTDETGALPKQFSYHDSFPASPFPFVSVAAFHPEYGSDYYEIPVEELQDGGSLELEIEKGLTIQGRVVFADGKPAARALVKMFGAYPLVGVGLIGIGNVTDEKGNFSFSGVRFDNIPGQLFVVHPVGTREKAQDSEAMEAIQAREKRMMFRIPDSAYKAEASLYDVGTVTLVDNL